MITVAVVNFRTPELTIQCLASLEPEVAAIEGARAVAVDNASGDGSAERIQAAIGERIWSGWASLLTLDENLGYAGGNQRAIDANPDTPYVLVLNSDTIVHRGCLAHCLAVMERERDVGALSCMLVEPDGTVQNVARRFPKPLAQMVSALGLPWKAPGLFGWADTEDPGWDRLTTRRDVGWIGGAFMFVRRAALEQVGGFYNGLFFYGEDIELCHRLMRAGWRRLYDPAVRVTHLGAGSSNPSRMPDEARSVYAYQARYLVQRKCYGLLAAWLLRAVDVAVWGARALRLTVVGRTRHSQRQRAIRIVKLLAGPLTASRAARMRGCLVGEQTSAI